MLFEVHGLILALHHDARASPAPPRRGRARLGRLPARRRELRRPGVLEEKSPARKRAREPARHSGIPVPESSRAHAHLHPALRDMQFVMHEVLNVVDEC